MQSRASIGGHGGQQSGKGHGRGEGRGGNNNLNNKDGDGDTNSSKERDNTFKPKDKSHIQCFRCKKYGHYKSKCRTKLQNEQDEQVNIVEVEWILVLACNVATSNVDRQDARYLDTWCSNHMCGKKELFSQLDESIWGNVNFGNKSKVLIMGKGNVKIRSKDGTNFTILDVFFCSRSFLEFVEYETINRKMAYY